VFAICGAIPTTVDPSLAFPVLDGTMVRVGFEDIEKSPLNLFLRSKLETLHSTDDIPIQLIGSQRLTMNEVRVWRPWETPNHPWMIHNL
jgi:hypothetical protein